VQISRNTNGTRWVRQSTKASKKNLPVQLSMGQNTNDAAGSGRCLAHDEVRK
jgi:hypothetical protein